MGVACRRASGRRCTAGGQVSGLSFERRARRPPHPMPRGGGGAWHDARLCCCLLRAAPIGLSPLALSLLSNPFPPQAAVPIGPSPPRALTLPLPGLSLPPLHPLPFPSGRCANGAPGLSLSHCPVSGPHGGGQRPSPLARPVQVDTPVTAAFGPRDVHLRGHLPHSGTTGARGGGGVMVSQPSAVKGFHSIDPTRGPVPPPLTTWMPSIPQRMHGPPGCGAFEGKGLQRRPQKRLGRRLEEVAEAVGGGYCRLQMPLSQDLASGGQWLGVGWAPWSGGGGHPPPSNASLALPLKQGDNAIRTGQRCNAKGHTTRGDGVDVLRQEEVLLLLEEDRLACAGVGVDASEACQCIGPCVGGGRGSGGQSSTWPGTPFWWHAAAADPRTSACVAKHPPLQETPTFLLL